MPSKAQSIETAHRLCLDTSQLAFYRRHNVTFHQEHGPQAKQIREQERPGARMPACIRNAHGLELPWTRRLAGLNRKCADISAADVRAPADYRNCHGSFGSRCCRPVHGDRDRQSSNRISKTRTYERESNQSAATARVSQAGGVYRCGGNCRTGTSSRGRTNRRSTNTSSSRV